MSSFRDYLRENATDLGKKADEAGISTPVSIGISGLAAVGLGSWGISNGAKEGKDAIIPSLAIGLGSIGTMSAISELSGMTSDSPLKQNRYAYPLLGLLLVIVVAISSQNIHKNKSQKDDEEKAEFWVNLIALLITLFSVIGMIAAKFGN